MVNCIREKVLLKASDFKPTSKEFEILGVLNPAAVRTNDGKIVLYVRVIERLKKFKDADHFYSPRLVGKNNFKMKTDKFLKKSIVASDDFGFEFKDETKRLTFISHLRRVVLDKGGFKILSIDNKPSFYGLRNDGELGIEDPRITKIEGKYYMTYVSLSLRESISVSLAVSSDCKRWKRLGIIFGVQDKDVVLFPEKIKNEYVAFDRPEGNFQFSPPHIWIAYSDDLIDWGKLKSVNLSPRHIDFYRSGAGPPPIKIDGGWFFLFHAVTKSRPKKVKGKVSHILGINIKRGVDTYAVWAALLDYKNPKKLLARSHHPILIPKKNYEVSFEGKKVVFPTGLVKGNNGKDLLIYSGAGDKVVTVKKLSLQSILKTLRKTEGN